MRWGEESITVQLSVIARRIAVCRSRCFVRGDLSYLDRCQSMRIVDVVNIQWGAGAVVVCP